MADVTTELAGEQVVLLPERALYWPRLRTLVAADLHWGKAAAFRAAGIPIPAGTTTADLARLSAAIARTGAERLTLLGDLFHARAGRVPATLSAITSWRSEHQALELLLVRGNHDRHAGDPPFDLRFTVVNGPYPAAPFVLRHEPAGHADGYVLAGHVHPGVTLHGPGRQSVRLPCFAFGRNVGLLPAFSTFTGTADHDVRETDRIFVVAGEDVIRANPALPERAG
jgi:DNA ligase-associated metallophosphoesterase